MQFFRRQRCWQQFVFTAAGKKEQTIQGFPKDVWGKSQQRRGASTLFQVLLRHTSRSPGNLLVTLQNLDKKKSSPSPYSNKNSTETSFSPQRRRTTDSGFHWIKQICGKRQRYLQRVSDRWLLWNNGLNECNWPNTWASHDVTMWVTSTSL